MATEITFNKVAATGRYECELTATGNRLCLQVKFDETSSEFNPASAFMDVLTQIDSDSEKVFLQSVEMWHNQNRMFILDIPMGVIITLSTLMPVLEAKTLDVLDV